MRKRIVYCGCIIFVFILIIGIIALVIEKSPHNLLYNTANNDSPEELYKQNNSIDLLVYNKTAYVNASKIDWVAGLDFKSNKKLGCIKRTNITKNFKNLDATVLEVGTDVYSVLDKEDFVLVSLNNVLIPYYAYVEG